MASSFAARFAPTAAINDARYLVVPCEAEGCADLALIWDRLEEQVVDVVNARARPYTDEDALWDEFRSAAQDQDWRQAA